MIHKGSHCQGTQSRKHARNVVEGGKILEPSNSALLTNVYKFTLKLLDMFIFLRRSKVGGVTWQTFGLQRITKARTVGVPIFKASFRRFLMWNPYDVLDVMKKQLHEEFNNF